MTEASATKHCPHCGGEVLAVAVKCKHCKKHIDTAAPLPRPVPQASEADYEDFSTKRDAPPPAQPKTCPACGGEILAAAVKCKHCKSRLDPAGSTGQAAPVGGGQTAGTLACAKCHARSPRTAKVCTQCGAKLQKPWPAIATAGLILGVVVVVVVVMVVVVTYQQNQAMKEFARQVEAEANAMEQQRRERAKRCQAIVQRMQTGSLSADDERWLGENAALVRRIQDDTLEGKDLKLNRVSLPCSESIADAFVAAVARSSAAWQALSSADDVSKDLLDMLGSRAKPALAAEAAKALRFHADVVAKRDLRGATSSDDLKTANGLCDLASGLLGTASSVCKRVKVRADRLAERESSAAERRERRSALQCANACRSYLRCVGSCSQDATDTESMYEAMKECGHQCQGEMTDDCAACSQQFR